MVFINMTLLSFVNFFSAVKILNLLWSLSSYFAQLTNIGNNIQQICWQRSAASDRDLQAVLKFSAGNPFIKT